MSDIANLLGTPDGFDPMSVEPQADYVAVPPGKYPIEIVKAGMKKTKAGTGHFLELHCKILADPGPAAGVVGSSVVGRMVFDRMNLDNPNQQAVDISLKSFAALGRSVGLARIPDSQLLVGKRCIACVKVKDGNNEIRTYEPLAVAAAPAAPAPAAPLPVTATPTATVPVQAPYAAPGNGPPVAAPAQPPLQATPLSPSPTYTAPVAAPVAPTPPVAPMAGPVVPAAPVTTVVAPAALPQTAVAAVGPDGQPLQKPWQK